MSRLSISGIGSGLQAFSALADRMRDRARGHYEHDDAAQMVSMARTALAEFNALSSEWSSLIALRKSADEDYDRYVTRDRECCSCHLSAPCSFCTSQPDPDEAAE